MIDFMHELPTGFKIQEIVYKGNIGYYLVEPNGMAVCKVPPMIAVRIIPNGMGARD